MIYRHSGSKVVEHIFRSNFPNGMSCEKKWELYRAGAPGSARVGNPARRRSVADKSCLLHRRLNRHFLFFFLFAKASLTAAVAEIDLSKAVSRE